MKYIVDHCCILERKKLCLWYLLVYDNDRTHTRVPVLSIWAINCPHEGNKHPRAHILCTSCCFLHLKKGRLCMHEPAQANMHRRSISTGKLQFCVKSKMAGSVSDLHCVQRFSYQKCCQNWLFMGITVNMSTMPAIAGSLPSLWYIEKCRLNVGPWCRRVINY